MIQSRREFLARVTALVVGMGLDPFRNVSVTDDRYRNTRIGVSFTKPRTWEYSSITDFAALRDKQILKDADLGEPHHLRDPQVLPAVLVEDPSNRDGYFVPCIGLYDEELDEPHPADEIRAHKVYLIDGFRKSYRSVRIRRQPAAVSLNGADGTISTWSYIHEIDGGIEHRLKVQSIVVLRPLRVQTWHLVDFAKKPRISNETWESFLQSIQYERLA